MQSKTGPMSAKHSNFKLAVKTGREYTFYLQYEDLGLLVRGPIWKLFTSVNETQILKISLVNRTLG